MSFTASTKVLLAGGAAVPISQLKRGEKVLATNTKTGKTQPEAVAAVVLHHDTDLYDLKITAGNKTAVIDTTSNHLFWIPGSTGHDGRWAKAGALKYGTHLRTPSGSGTAVVTGGWVPRQRDEWMWDLTVPGDHDFCIDTVDAPVLVHNCPEDLQEIEDHIVPRHTPGGVEADATKSLFDTGESLENLAEGSAGRIGLRQANGNIQRVIHAPCSLCQLYPGTAACLHEGWPVSRKDVVTTQRP